MDWKRIEEVNAKLPKTDIKGKGYVEVNARVKAFRELFPEGSIETEIISDIAGVCCIKATVKDKGAVIATGHAYEKESSHFINKTSYIENCETSAVGRALGFIGIGIDTSIASYEEVETAQANQTISVKEAKILVSLAMNNGWGDEKEAGTKLLEHFGVKKLSEVTGAQFAKFAKEMDNGD